eukprot:TRINITY_DN32124_c0_g1_i1.p2 TRINITY_DN32124_c0_g1~~TRINITY_DN32124_c0_g1_i1.p2  ORF type:complete len:120 (-),score=0.05 TRINITY_DN32124_c0_g1_i1:3-362(-)
MRLGAETGAQCHRTQGPETCALIASAQNSNIRPAVDLIIGRHVANSKQPHPTARHTVHNRAAATAALEARFLAPIHASLAPPLANHCFARARDSRIFLSLASCGASSGSGAAAAPCTLR